MYTSTRRPFYGEYAWAFDLLIDRPVRRECAAIVSWFIERGVLPGARVLDGGCGTGRGEIMKNLVTMLCLLLGACAHAQPPTLVIRGATVVDIVDGSFRPEHTVLIAGNRMTAVGPADQVRVPDDADLVDAAGGFLIPGLWDMHVHSVANVTWDMNVRAIRNAEWHFPLFLAYGVTGVRNMNDATADRTLEHPAKVLGMAGSLGTIEVGKLADLVLLDANPLTDIGNTRRIRAVVADGRLYRRADLDRLLAGVEMLNQQ
jgi:hypothetical protein